MDLGLKGKNALVAASSQGLGYAVAMCLASEGANVALCGRTEATLDVAQAQISSKTDSQVIYCAGDVSIIHERDRIIHHCREAFGHIDILVTNTGGPPPGRFETHDDDAWLQTYHQLLGSAVGLVRGVLPDMKSRNWGRIISITSQAVKQPVNNLVLSNAVRASVVGLMRTLANELGPDGITVNNVMPGFTRTQRLEKLMANSPDFTKLTAEIPLGRIGEPEEFAAMVTFLASEQASYITGVSVPVDGGWIKSLL